MSDAMTEEEKKALRSRNIALALALLAMVVLFFVVTLAQLGGNVANRHL